ncbi:hypothetical protein [Psychrobacter sp. NPDC078501]|uniref:hypothetical protein n=1 Tax=Psychrobacter sp. NPDC078501 TaxID=3364495 RepID=UPI0022EA142D
MSDNYTKTDVKARHGENSSLIDGNLSVNSQNLSLNAANLSLIRNITNRVTKLAKNTNNDLFSDNEKKGCNRGDYPFLGSFLTSGNNENHSFTSHDNKRYYRVLSNSNSGHASRHPLAFFVPDNGVDSQTHSNYSSTAPKAHLSASRAQTLIFMAAPQCLPNNYDGMTLQNKIAFGRICRAVSVRTESEPRHPIPLSYSLAPTQNLTGGYHA